MARKKDKNDKKIKEIVSFMDDVLGDTSVPKNIKRAVTDAKNKLLSNEDPVLCASSAIYYLESISEDINLPMHARTQIWQIVSVLETIKGE
jgi:uncharacterized protein